MHSCLFLIDAGVKESPRQGLSHLMQATSLLWRVSKRSRDNLLETAQQPTATSEASCPPEAGLCALTVDIIGTVLEAVPTRVPAVSVNEDNKAT